MRTKLIWILLCLPSYLFFTQTFHDVMNPNESSRILLTSAIVDDHSFSLDHAMARYGSTVDRSYFNGHYYSAKGIGYSLMAIPFYFVVTRLSPGLPLEAIVWILRLFLNFIPLTLFAFWFAKYLRDRIGAGNGAYLI